MQSYQNQKGFGLILLIIGLALMGLLVVLYLTGSDPPGNAKAPIEAGQEGIEQAKQINQDSQQYQSTVNQQLEVQDIQNQLP